MELKTLSHSMRLFRFNLLSAEMRRMRTNVVDDSKLVKGFEGIENTYKIIAWINGSQPGSTWTMRYILVVYGQNKQIQIRRAIQPMDGALHKPSKVACSNFYDPINSQINYHCV